MMPKELKIGQRWRYTRNGITHCIVELVNIASDVYGNYAVRYVYCLDCPLLVNTHSNYNLNNICYEYLEGQDKI